LKTTQTANGKKIGIWVDTEKTAAREGQHKQHLFLRRRPQKGGKKQTFGREKCVAPYNSTEKKSQRSKKRKFRKTPSKTCPWAEMW